MTPTTPTRFVDNGDGTVTDTTTGRLHTPMKCVCTQKGAGCTNRCDRKVSAPTVAPAEGRENTWIALDDAMPEPERFVLTWDGKRVGVDWWGSKRHRGDGVTHWAPFAAPPGAGPMYGIAHPLTPENAP
jgi:hypothetical protein